MGSGRGEPEGRGRGEETWGRMVPPLGRDDGTIVTCAGRRDRCPVAAGGALPDDIAVFVAAGCAVLRLEAGE